MMDAGVEFLESSIRFINYEFPPASIFPGATIKVGDIMEVDLVAAPPCFRIGEELIFVSAVHKDRLKQFADQNEIPIISRIDLWDAILEPFLDTEFSQEQQQRTLDKLAEFGLDENKVDSWRDKVKEAMVLYNFGTGLWDWVHLGQWDLLTAHMGSLNEDEFGNLYWDSMELALRAYQ